MNREVRREKGCLWRRTLDSGAGTDLQLLVNKIMNVPVELGELLKNGRLFLIIFEPGILLANHHGAGFKKMTGPSPLFLRIYNTY
jgi:hypothetical protein